MARRYDSSRRAKAAQRTRDQIVAAAFRLHGQGVIDTEALAKEANVSVATVRKHFPTREILFENCTAYGLHLSPLPDLPSLVAIEDLGGRTTATLSQLHDFYESLLGQIWASYKHEDQSAVLAGVVQQLDDLVRSAADVILAARPGVAEPEADGGVLLGLLSPLTYRAMRIQGGLPPERVKATINSLALSLLTGGNERREPQ